MNCHYCSHDAGLHDSRGCGFEERVFLDGRMTVEGCECARDGVQAAIAPPEPEE